MSSTHASPPRKRVRSSTNSAMIGDAHASSSANASGVGPTSSVNAPSTANLSDNAGILEQPGSPHSASGGVATASSAAANTRSKMKLKSSGRRHGGSNSNNANYLAGNASFASNPEEEDDDDEYESLEDEGDINETLLRKVPVRNQKLTASDREVVRLIGQHLTSIGLKTSAEVLMREAGCRLDQPSAAVFRQHVMHGEWAMAVKALESLKAHLENPAKMVEIKYLLLEQKYLELLSQKRQVEALKVLQTELTPLNHRQNRTHELSTYLMLSKAEDISRVTRSVRGGELSGMDLMERLQSFFPASVMLPPRRLHTLLSQAAEFQIDRCLFHNSSSVLNSFELSGTRSSSQLSPLDSSFLALDHQCEKDNFPHETIQVLADHCEEAWYCKFSSDGLRLATGSKDMTVIVWDFDPETLTFKKHRVLERQPQGVSFFAWSPDSTRLAICGIEDCDEIVIWNIDGSEEEIRVSQSSQDSLSSVCWSPDGSKIACDFTLIQEDHGIMSFTLDEMDRYALLNIANQGIHMWDIESRILVRKFEGVTQGFCIIHSCFGGRDQNFIASGSEDKKVYIYHNKREKPICVLSGHTRTVNCVDWNPVYPNIVVSASDDSTLRVWGPSAEFRRSAQSGNNSRQSSHSSNTSLAGSTASGNNQNGSVSNGIV
eukprot:TCALIF_11648-PA protein Name:"Similar to wdr26 WD repeat-containing protein 26 (Danio rerio)" AED:0.14 eAED:0.15 QI:0/0/0/1/1/1/5/0/658